MSQKPSARIFQPDNTFDRTVRNPGGVSAAAAISAANEAIEDMRPEVEVWMNTALQEITRVSNTFKKGPMDKDSLDMLKRNANYLHDLGTTMGFPLVTFVAQNFCDVLETVQDNSAGKSLIECHANALLVARQEKYRNLQPSQVAEFSEGLRSLLKIAQAPRTP